jgi:hypothetical protein
VRLDDQYPSPPRGKPCGSDLARTQVDKPTNGGIDLLREPVAQVFDRALVAQRFPHLSFEARKLRGGASRNEEEQVIADEPEMRAS